MVNKIMRWLLHAVNLEFALERLVDSCRFVDCSFWHTTYKFPGFHSRCCSGDRLTGYDTA